MRRSRLALCIAATIAAVCALAGCSSSGKSTPSKSTAAAKPSAPTAGDGCPSLRTGGKAVSFGGGIAGYMYGTGTIGVVFGHESNGSACDWMQEAQTLGQQGYRTLALDFNGYGASTPSGHAFSQDIVDGATFLGTQGATSIVLIGSSMGGSAVLAATPSVTLPVKAVIALSSPAAFAGSNALAAAPKITVPLLMICGNYDTGIIDDVKGIYAAATATKQKKLLLLDTATHGRLLVQAGVGSEPQAIDAFNAFLKTYAPIE
jgi:pimeloyl-ACP methyl ester carboxylesterase